MMGSSVAAQSDSKFNMKVWELVTHFKDIFKTSTKLLSVPPAFADKWNLRIWKDFESAAMASLEICKCL